MSEWQDISTAPKDGTCILLLSKEHTDPADFNGGPYHHPARCAIGRWNAEGDSWCDEHGRFPDDPNVDDDTLTLRITGVWFSGGGWFQPNEVTHWMPLPDPPERAAPGPHEADTPVRRGSNVPLIRRGEGELVVTQASGRADPNPSPSGRACMRCGAQITACNGFTLARDWLRAVTGEIQWRQVRELCGKCSLAKDLFQYLAATPDCATPNPSPSDTERNDV